MPSSNFKILLNARALNSIITLHPAGALAGCSLYLFRGVDQLASKGSMTRRKLCLLLATVLVAVSDCTVSAQDGGIDEVWLSTKRAQCVQIVLAELQPHTHRL